MIWIWKEQENIFLLIYRKYQHEHFSYAFYSLGLKTLNRTPIYFKNSASVCPFIFFKIDAQIDLNIFSVLIYCICFILSPSKVYSLQISYLADVSKNIILLFLANSKASSVDISLSSEASNLFPSNTYWQSSEDYSLISFILYLTF